MHHPLTTRPLGTASQIHSPDKINPGSFNVKIKLYFINYELKSDYSKNIQSNQGCSMKKAKLQRAITPTLTGLDIAYTGGWSL